MLALLGGNSSEVYNMQHFSLYRKKGEFEKCSVDGRSISQMIQFVVYFNEEEKSEEYQK